MSDNDGYFAVRLSNDEILGNAIERAKDESYIKIPFRYAEDILKTLVKYNDELKEMQDCPVDKSNIEIENDPALEYARGELARINSDQDEIQCKMERNILEIIQVFNNQGHTGFTAQYAISKIERLLRFLPLTALTGEESEWGEPDNQGHQQNLRCSHVWRHADGSAYDYHGKIFSDNGGETWFTNIAKGSIGITFPYYPPTKPEMVYLDKNQDKSEAETLKPDTKQSPMLFDYPEAEMLKPDTEAEHLSPTPEAGTPVTGPKTEVKKLDVTKIEAPLNEMRFYNDLRDLINNHSIENLSDTPDFIIANFLMECLRAFNENIKRRDFLI